MVRKTKKKKGESQIMGGSLSKERRGLNRKLKRGGDGEKIMVGHASGELGIDDCQGKQTNPPERVVGSLPLKEG